MYPAQSPSIPTGTPNQPRGRGLLEGVGYLVVGMPALSIGSPGLCAQHREPGMCLPCHHKPWEAEAERSEFKVFPGHTVEQSRLHENLDNGLPLLCGVLQDVREGPCEPEPLSDIVLEYTEETLGQVDDSHVVGAVWSECGQFLSPHQPHTTCACSHVVSTFCCPS